MSNPVSALTALALAADQLESLSQRLPGAAFGYNDPIMDELIGLTYISSSESESLVSARSELENDTDLAPILSIAGQEDAMISSPLIGGSRQGFDGVVTALLSSAAKQLYVQQIARTESSFTRAVLENYDELKRALRGERIRAYAVRGISGIRLDPGLKISTPWGTVRGVEASSGQVAGYPGRFGLQTTALLVSPILVPVNISREPEPPQLEPDSKDLDETQRTHMLTPLLFALASEHDHPIAPMITFQTTITPFIDNLGFSSSFLVNPFIPTSDVASSDCKRIEDLARMLYDNYHDSLQIASVRVVSAISQRLDKADALIDAVTSWENLVGTRNETAYRVTAALTLLLEPDARKRSALRKQLGEIYAIRSRVVHGDIVDGKEITEASETAIRIALKAMLELYRRSGDWLSMKSGQRSEKLILGG